MQLVYITNARFPTRKAYGVNIIRTCESLARLGMEVTLFAPSYKRDGGADGIPCFSAHQEFKTQVIRTRIDGVTWGRLGFWVNRFVFLFHIFFSKSIGRPRGKVILTRDELSGWLLRRCGYTVFYDLHGFPPRKSRLWEKAIRDMSGIIVTSPSKVERVHALGVSPEKIVVAPNGFDPALFGFNANREALRVQLNLPRERKIAMYTGHLYDWKGVFVLARAALLLPDVYFVFVGGTPWDIDAFKKKYGVLPNVIIVGYKPNEIIPQYLKAADVLVLPNSRLSHDRVFAAHSESDTSPIKLFEYMASGVPIVASDLPSIREVLGEENSILVAPDNSEALRDGIETVLRGHSFVDTLSARALSDSKHYTWGKRAEKIARFISANV